MQSLKTNSFDGILSRLRSSTAVMLLVVLIIGSILLNLVTQTFFSAYNISTLIRTISFTTIAAFGQTLVLLTGGIDLSVAGIAGLSGIVSGWLMVNTSIDPFLCIFLTLLFGFGGGLINGVLVTYVALVPFIATLATGTIFTGFIYVFTQGWPIQNLPEKVFFLGRGMIGRIPIPFIIMLIIAAILVWVLNFLPFGRYIYAVGGNENAARITGIKHKQVKLIVYGLSGVLASLGGILITCRLGAAQPTVGSQWVMPTVTAAVIGGTSLLGGQGGIIGTIVGSALTGIISNAIVLLGVSSYWENVIIGLVVLIAVTIDRIRIYMYNK
ncbi:ABC transporter permease [Spirochaetia bacterium]|nr:ABC transporter permease [Spirochaetia bacterium]